MDRLLAGLADLEGARHDAVASTGLTPGLPLGFEDNGWLEAYCPPREKGSSYADSLP
jgi:hypothetical protein